MPWFDLVSALAARAHRRRQRAVAEPSDTAAPRCAVDEPEHAEPATRAVATKRLRFDVVSALAERLHGGRREPAAEAATVAKPSRRNRRR